MSQATLVEVKLRFGVAGPIDIKVLLIFFGLKEFAQKFQLMERQFFLL
jgi:hypothetical protein